MAAPCAKCESRVDEWGAPWKAWVPVQCRTCARAALRDKAKAEKIVLDNCADCEFDRACRDKTCPAYQIHAAAARIAKRKAAK